MKAHFTISIKKIRELDADIYVIQEVNNPKNKDADYEEFMKNSILLLYDNEDKSGNNKGIAVVAKEGIRLKNNHGIVNIMISFLLELMILLILLLYGLIKKIKQVPKNMLIVWKNI